MAVLTFKLQLLHKLTGHKKLSDFGAVACDWAAAALSMRTSWVNVIIVSCWTLQDTGAALRQQ